jgi:hypothetical protein
MKRLFYITGTICFLAVTLLIGFHLGHTSAEAQGNGEVVSISSGPTSGDVWFATSTGDVYRRSPKSGKLEYQGNLKTSKTDSR